MTPASIGPYLVAKEIGRGPTGQVWLVTAPEGHHLALKAMSALDMHQRDTLRQNDIINRRLVHHHIIAWLAADFDHDPPYIVMPYLAGGSLADKLRAGAITPHHAITWLRQLALSLDYAHYQGVAHGALKPTNILFDVVNTPYLSDFGFGELVNPDVHLLDMHTRRQADVRAMGELAFWALTGQPPAGQTANALNPALPPAVDKVLARFERAEEPLLTLIHALGDSLGMTFPPLVHNTLGQATRWVGRDTELRHLQAAYRAVHSHAGLQAVLITGEDGVGKTRLVDELLNWVINRPEINRYIHTHMRPNGPPYSLFRSVVQFRLSHLPRVDPRPMTARLEWMVSNLLGEPPAPHHQETAHVIGHLAGFDMSSSPHVRPLLADPQQLAERGQQLFLRWLSAASRKEPVILVVDDAHLADVASQQTLQALAATRQRDDILLIIISRPGYYERRAEWHGLLQHLPLGPLSAAQTQMLIRNALDDAAPLPPTLAETMTRYTEGNPALTVQWLQRLNETGIVTPTASGRWQVNEARLAEVRLSLADLLNDRLRALSNAEQAVLRRAAILGALTSLESVAMLAAVDGVTAEWPAVMQTLVTRNFLRPETAHTFGFVPAVFGEIVYADIPPTLRQAYHAATAQWLLQQPNIHPRLLARHYAAAGQLTEAAICLARAAAAAGQVGAYHEALDDASQGLAWLADQPDTELAVQLRLQHAEANHHLGRYAEAQASLQTVLRSPHTPVQRFAALTLTAANLRRQGDNQGAHTQLTALLLQANAPVPAYLQLQARNELAGACWRLGQLDEAIQHYQGALDQALQRHEPHWQAQALLGLGIVYVLKNQPETSQRYLERAYTRASASGNRRQALSALNNLGVTCTVLGQHDRALTFTHKALDIARELDSPGEVATTLSNLAEIYLKQDKAASARLVLCEALTIMHALGPQPWQLNIFLPYADWLHTQNRLAEAVALWRFIQAHPASDHAQRAQAVQRLQAHADVPPAPDAPTDIAGWVAQGLRDTAPAG